MWYLSHTVIVTTIRKSKRCQKKGNQRKRTNTASYLFTTNLFLT